MRRTYNMDTLIENIRYNIKDMTTKNNKTGAFVHLGFKGVAKVNVEVTIENGVIQERTITTQPMQAKLKPKLESKLIDELYMQLQGFAIDARIISNVAGDVIRDGELIISRGKILSSPKGEFYDKEDIVLPVDAVDKTTPESVETEVVHEDGVAPYEKSIVPKDEEVTFAAEGKLIEPTLEKVFTTDKDAVIADSTGNNDLVEGKSAKGTATKSNPSNFLPED